MSSVPPDDEMSHSEFCPHRDCVQLHHLCLQSSVERSTHWTEWAASPCGEDHWNVKLSEADVRTILASPTPAEVLAARYNVRRHTFASIRAGRRWRWLR